MKNIIKNISIILVLICLLIALIYISDIDNIPDNIILFEGETLRVNTIFGVDIETKFSSNPNIERIENNETITVAADTEDSDYTGTISLNVTLLGYKVKEVSVSVIENTEVVPIGNIIGLKLYTNRCASSRNVRNYWNQQY